MANAKVTEVDFTIHTDIPHRGDECTVGFNWEAGALKGSGGFSADLARASAIMMAVGYADAVEYDQQNDALHIIVKATP